MNPAAGPELRDIHLPPAPGWWPPAPGWWVVAAIVLVALAYVTREVYLSTKRRRIRRLVLAELDHCIERGRGDPAMLAASLSQFLRRIALRATPEAAAYSGERWIGYLDKQTQTDEFSQGPGRVLLDAPFKPQTHYDAPALIALVRRFTRNALDKGAFRV
ncbi:MAG: DUF4381 domain-containing protein [Rudaea sp.]